MGTRCWHCGTEMIWQCDYSYEDYGKEGDGIVAVLYCPHCKTLAEFYKDFSDDVEEI